MSACLTLSTISNTLPLVTCTPFTTKSLNVTVFVFEESITVLVLCKSGAFPFKILLGIDGSSIGALGGVSPVLLVYQSIKAIPIITPAAIKIPLLGHHESSFTSTGTGISWGLASDFSSAAFPFSST